MEMVVPMASAGCDSGDPSHSCSIRGNLSFLRAFDFEDMPMSNRVSEQRNLCESTRVR